MYESMNPSDSCLPPVDFSMYLWFQDIVILLFSDSNILNLSNSMKNDDEYIPSVYMMMRIQSPTIIHYTAYCVYHCIIVDMNHGLANYHPNAGIINNCTICGLIPYYPWINT